MYTIACKIPTVMALLAGIFMEAWQFSAVTESQGKTEERDYFFSRIWELLQAALFLFGSFLIAFAKPEIMNMDEIDGALVGGASLKPKDFMEIIDF